MNSTDDCLSLLYKKHINILYGFGVVSGIDHDTCLDIIQDVFCNIIEKNISFEDKNIKSYLFRCFINRHIDIQRSKSHKKNISIDINDLPVEFVMPATDIMNGEEMIEKEETLALKQQQVEILLNHLPPQQRKAVFLRYIEEMEYKDIGNQLNIKIESVRKMVFRAIEKLRNHVGVLAI